MFVVFEGIDGSGKTTVSNMVVERLRASDLSVKHLRAEGKFVSAVSESIRAFARDSKNIDLVPRAEFLLYVARDVQLIEEALRDALQTYDVVIADRFLYTAQVLGRFGRSLPSDYVEPVIAAAAGGLSPDLVVLVDVDPVLARARRKASKIVAKDERPPSRKGLSGVGLQHRLRRGYLELAAEAPERWVVVRNEDALDQTVCQVHALIERAVHKGPTQALREFAGHRSATGKRGAGEITTAQHALEALIRWVHERAEREPQVAAYVLGGLHGPAVDGLRRRLAGRVPEVVLNGARGLVDECSWELRDRLATTHPVAVARSLGGAAAVHPRALPLRTALLAHAPEEVLKTLSQVDADAAWTLRDELLEHYPDAVIGSLSGLDSERAWMLRRPWLSRHKRELEEHYEKARTAAKSVAALSSAEAWEVREAVRGAAPLAAIGSLSGLTCSRSFELREHYLLRAPKVVMGTLNRVCAPEAWAMRRRVASETKEAIDSLSGLNTEEAWELRESYADLWPSTVIKTLGPWADSERGQRLLEHQLARHAENVSLLKHAAAIALGNHLDKRAEGL